MCMVAEMNEWQWMKRHIWNGMENRKLYKVSKHSKVVIRNSIWRYWSFSIQLFSLSHFSSLFHFCCVPLFSMFHFNACVYVCVSVCTRKVLYIVLCRHPHFQSIFPYSMELHMRIARSTANFVARTAHVQRRIFPLVHKPDEQSERGHTLHFRLQKVMVQS